MANPRGIIRKYNRSHLFFLLWPGQAPATIKCFSVCFFRPGTMQDALFRPGRVNAIWGPAVCIGILRKMPKSRRRTPGKPEENHVFSWFFHGLLGRNPFQNLRKTRPIILNQSQPPSTLPDPFYIIFTFLFFF